MLTKETIFLEKKCCDMLLSFLEAFLKRNQGEDLYITLKTIERFSFECRKTKTKVITLANHKEHRQYSEPTKTIIILLVIICS